LREQGGIEDVTQVLALEPVGERLDQAAVHGADRSGNRFVDGDLVQWVVLPERGEPELPGESDRDQLVTGDPPARRDDAAPDARSEGPAPWNAR
jgi:hypothetical protein